jgi:NAD(P) transhydrogenase
MRYDLIVVGSGPAGQKAAIAAAKQNWRVAVIERKRELLGGVSLHSGTIPSKTIREAIVHLTGYRQRDVYEDTYRRKREITMNDLRRKMEKVAQADWQVLQDQFARNRVNVVYGEATFLDPHCIAVDGKGDRQTFEAKHILLAPGTPPPPPPHNTINRPTHSHSLQR